MSKKRVSIKVGFAIAIALASFGCAKEQKAQQDVSRQDVQKSSLQAEVIQSAKIPEKAKPTTQILLELDADGNGLYDDTERKAMLDVLQAECPELKGIIFDADGLYDDTEHKEMIAVFQAECPELEGIAFDADGDGKVTVVEQDQGRHPLSKLVPMHFLDNNKKIPWTIDLFSEWLMSAYFQEDVRIGAAAKNLVRGSNQNLAEQANEAQQPQKSAARSGVEFAANSGQHFTMRGNRDARWNYRWCVVTFRIDAETGSADKTILLDINQGRGPSKSSPKIFYSKAEGLRVQYVGRGKDGLDERVMTTHGVAVDGKTWNVLVCGLRQGRMFASVNGVMLETAEEQPGRFSSEMAHDAKSFIGDNRASNMAWAYDAIVLGQTEISEAMVRKLSGWAAHRLGFQDRLPSEHAYRHARPVLDVEDFPHRYKHDEEKWPLWGVQMKDRAITRVNAGGPRVEPSGFERVFFDDFRAFRIGLSTSGEDDLWMAPGFNTAVGAGARLALPGREPNVYTHDAEQKLQYLSLAKQGNTWFGSAFYSINDMAQGYTWDGAKVFRIRCKFPKTVEKELTRGLFPAFWSYGTEFLFWRTSNRIEVDWFEFDGKNGRRYNGISTHFHYTNVKNTFVKQNESYPSHKLYSGMLTEAKSGIPGGFFFWDGQFHTWEFVVDYDMTVVNVTVPDGKGGDRWVEVCRGPTVPTYLERLDLQINYALDTKTGTPGDDVREDYIVDWVEVLQKTDAVQTVSEPFVARPMLTGTTAVGGTLHCQANVVGITDLRYYWFADGYPLTYGADSTYVLTSAEAGKHVRCMVKAVGARDMPEAWTNPMEIGSGDD